jgi:hypothetical protein
MKHGPHGQFRLRIACPDARHYLRPFGFGENIRHLQEPSQSEWVCRAFCNAMALEAPEIDFILHTLDASRDSIWEETWY